MADQKNIKEKNLLASLYDGIFAGGMIGFTQDYFAPFLLVLGGTGKDFGILSSLPNFAAALAQFFSADLTDKVRSRKKVFTLFVLLQAGVLLPIVLMALREQASPASFIILATLFTAFGAFAMPAWGSLMSDLVSQNKRGIYFGWRNKVLGLIVVAMSFLAGFILHGMEKIDIYKGFAVIFSAAFLFRVLSWYFLTTMQDMPLEHKRENYFTVVQFLRRFRESNFAKFVIFVALLNFSVNLASPFFAVFMLRDLKFSYLLYTVITITATLTVYLLNIRWGRHADKIGNLKIIRFTAPIIATLPLWWVINRNPVFLILTQVVAGFAWAGFNLCASNFIYDAVTPEKRTRCIAYFNVFNGIALCIGALLGGFLVERLPALFGYQILPLFVTSSSLRLLVAFLAPFKPKEVRKKGAQKP